MKPKLSYGAKTLLLDIRNFGLDRRDFLKRSLVFAAGVTFLAVSITGTARPSSAADLYCGCYGDCHSQCYSNCHCACHSDCGRKGW